MSAGVQEQQLQLVELPPASSSSSSSSGASTMAVDLAAGTIAGVAQLLVGHPFDTIKVKLQSSSGRPAAAGAAASATSTTPAFSGPLDAVKQTVQNEGLRRGLYKGMGAPLATVALFNAVLFSSRGQAQALLARKDGSPLTLNDQLAAAVAASCAVSLVATPTELLKCRLQAQGCSATAMQRLRDAGLDPAQHTIYRGPRDVARHVLRHEGGALGLMRGLTPTLGREVVGNVCMFGVYEAIKAHLVASRGLRSARELSSTDLLVAGGLGGTAFWLGAFPIDLIKSKLQVDSYAAPRYRGALDCARQVVASEGFKGLYRGFVPALARSFPANAACFVVYEAAKSFLQDLSAPLLTTATTAAGGGAVGASAGASGGGGGGTSQQRVAATAAAAV